MARYFGPKQKISRRYSEPLFGYSKSLERKPYGPGQHGKARKGKMSDYAVQLKEKQKAKFIYGVLERQFENTFTNAARKKGATGENLMQMLEARLDNTVFRLGFATSRRGGRQLVSHKHIMVNGRIVNIPSYQVKPGDIIEVREGSRSLESIEKAVSAYKPGRYSWLELEKVNFRGRFLSYPSRDDIPENVQERLIVELYSR